MIRKTTSGFVTQNFDDDGRLINQNFTAGDEVQWEDENWNEIEPRDFYYPFKMAKPKPSTEENE